MFTNPYFLLMLGSLTGMLLGKTNKTWQTIWNSIKDKVVHKVEVEQENDLYRIVNLFLQNNWENKCRSAIGKWTKDSKELKPTYNYSSAIFTIKYRGKRLVIKCDREKMDKFEYNFGLYINRLSISGFMAKQVINEFLVEAISKYAFKRPTGTIGIFGKRGYEGFSEINEISPKLLTTLVYRDNIGIKIRNDIHSFINNKDWYKERGISYKRIYCFYGPPGTGKTSLILSLALEFNKDVYMLDLLDLTSESDLMRLIGTIPAGAIILLEDVERPMNSENLKISISSIMNLLDGPFTKKGMLLFMTTNHIDKIDPALLRDGRVDMKINIGLAGQQEIQHYLQLFYNRKIDYYLTKQFPISTVQEICLINKDNPDAAIHKLTLSPGSPVERLFV